MSKEWRTTHSHWIYECQPVSWRSQTSASFSFPCRDHLVPPYSTSGPSSHTAKMTSHANDWRLLDPAPGTPKYWSRITMIRSLWYGQNWPHAWPHKCCWHNIFNYFGYCSALHTHDLAAAAKEHVQREGGHTTLDDVTCERPVSHVIGPSPQ